jgi:hypothetical protein
MAIAAGTSPSIALATKSSNNNQVFTAVAKRSGFYLESKATGKVIGIANDATFSGALVEQRRASGHATQRFVTNSLGSGMFSIRNLGSGYYLSLLYDRATDGNGFNQSAYRNVCGQKFKLESVSLAERGALSTIQAESFTSQYGSQTNSGIVGYLDAGDYLHYRALDFGVGAKSLSLLVAVPPTAAGKKIEVRLDGKSGALVGALTVQDTGSWSTFKAQAINLSTTITGVHDLYFVMSGGADVANIDSFTFSTQSIVVEPPPVPAERSAYTTIQAESYTTQFGSQVMGGTVGYLDAGDYLHFKAVGFDDGAKSVSFEVAVPSTAAGKKIEVRLDSKTGTLVGSLTVQNTGGWSAYTSQAINLTTTITGVRDLYLVMASGSDVANIDSFVFSKQPVSASTPEPTPTPPSAVRNSVTTILDDMALPSTYPIAKLVNGSIIEQPEGGYPSKYSHIIMGRRPHGSASPSWWSPSAGYEYLKTTSWNRIVPWLVILTGTGNKATNIRIEFRNIKSYYKSRSKGQWILIGSGAVDGYNCPPGQWDVCSGATDIYTLPDGSRTLKPSGTGSNFHGWGGSGNIPDPFDVEIYFTTLQARIVGTDTGRAQYMIHVGTDFYAPGITVSQMSGYNPGSGYSRSKGLTTSWQSFNYATIDNAPFVINKAYTVSPSVLISAPPPLD